VWNFKELVVWQRSRALVRQVYDASRLLPSDERFGLSSQMRRAVVSIGANIAEGSGRASVGERRSFLGYAIASADELEHHVILCGDLEYWEQQMVTDLAREIDEIRRMTKALRQIRTP
jgi:four helix bundle protein